jgi:hypothetical protein
MRRENWQGPSRPLTGADRQSAQPGRALAGFFRLSIRTVMPFLLLANSQCAAFSRRASWNAMKPRIHCVLTP